MTTSTSELFIDGFSIKKVNYDPFVSGAILKATHATNGQRELLSFINDHEEATLCFNDAVKVEFVEYIDSHLLNLAFKTLIQNYDALRMVFNDTGELISFKEQATSSLVYHDFTNLLEADEFLKEMCSHEVLLPFDLEKGPCIRGYFIKLKNERSVLILSVHRIVCDRSSLCVLLNEFATYYNMLLLGKKPLPPQHSFFDYTLKVNLKMEDDKVDWNKNSSLLRSKQLPSDFERPAQKRYRSKRIDFSIPESTVKSLKVLCANEKCSLENTLIAALSVLISRITHSDEILIGFIDALPYSTSEKRLIGFMEKILPLKIQLAQTENFQMLLKEVRKKMANAFDHPALASAFDVVFNVGQISNPEELTFGKAKACCVTIPREYESVEIFINALFNGDKMTLQCQYNSELFEISTITNWLQIYAELLSSFSEFKTETIEKIFYKKIKNSRN